MNKYAVLILLAMAAIASCKRTYMQVCDLPRLVLEPVDFTAEEWDTVITRVYNPGFSSPIITDTFIAENADDVLLVSIGSGDAKDFEIEVPAINKIYRLHNIMFTERTLTVTEGAEEQCYHDMSFVLDGVDHQYNGAELIQAALHK